MLAKLALIVVSLWVAYLAWQLLRARFARSRCCDAKVRYTFGWDYKGDGLVCRKCGMLQD